MADARSSDDGRRSRLRFVWTSGCSCAGTSGPWCRAPCSRASCRCSNPEPAD